MSEYAGKYQDCNIPSRWPFAQLAGSVAAARPDLIIHVGDYLYRESACPANDTRAVRAARTATTGRPGKPTSSRPPRRHCARRHGSRVRGNHGICKRAGAGYFRLLDPRPAQAPPCVELVPSLHRHRGRANHSSCWIRATPPTVSMRQPPPMPSRFAAMRPAPAAGFSAHRPVWGFRSTARPSMPPCSRLWRPDGRLPDGITLVLAGHIHLCGGA